MKDFSQFGINTNGRTSGKMKTFCPKCHDRRKDKRDRSLSLDLDKGIAYCHYCEETFNANIRGGGAKTVYEAVCSGTRIPTVSNSSGGNEGSEALQPSLPVDSEAPKPDFPLHSISQEHVDWFLHQRGIGKEALQALGVTSSLQYMPQARRKEWVIAFNYFENGKLINTKYRSLDKYFKMTSGAEVIPYNIDAIKDTPQCVIAEGEPDTLSFVQIGRTDVISVPTGANANLTWMDRFVATHFENKQVIYIAVDADRKGQELGKELIRRLGAPRCRTLTYPDGCKDANEVLVKHGSEALIRALAEAPETPLEGVFTIKDVNSELRFLFEKGMERGAETGWANFDECCTFELGRLCVITGIPGTGKSEFIDELIMRLNIRHGWKAAYFSPENMPLAYHLRKLMEKATGQRFKQGYLTEPAYVKAEKYLQENYSFILPKDNFTVDNILSTAEELVRRVGIRQLAIDPFNRFEHQIPHGQTETQYISAVLDKFTNFALRNNCLLFLVGHPKKMYKEPGSLKEPVPTLYDINGSAAFFNKCDFGITVERDREAEVTRIHIQKVKFRHLGNIGKATFQYNTVNGRYSPCQIDESTGKGHNPQFDNTEWMP